jgi:hypothetical protein
MKLIHYSPIPFVLERRVVQQDDPQDLAVKPCGLWVSVDDAWHTAALEMFGDDDLKHASQITLTPKARILYLKTVGDIDHFTDQYTVVHDEHYQILGRAIDWPKVAQEYQGIIISPYQFQRRLTPHTFWYYGWDCACGCIWDTDAIVAVEVAA